MGDTQKNNESKFSLTRVENIFFFNGIASLIGWNSILGTLDYFSSIYKDYNVFLYFPIPVFIAYAITGVTFNMINKKYSYESLVKIGITGGNICVVLLVITSVIFKNSPHAGFWLSIFECFFVGIFSNFTQLSFFGMINYFGGGTVSRFTIGTAASGLMLIVLRAIITAAFQSGDDSSSVVPVLIYYALSVIFNFFDLSLNMKLFKTETYQQNIGGASSSVIEPPLTDSLISNKQNNKVQQASYAVIMWQSFKNTTPYPLYIFFNFVMTFMLFPDLTLAKKTVLSPTWNSIVFLMAYNIGDFGGKLIADFRGSFNARSICYLFFSRLFFFYTIPLMDKQFTQDDHLLNNNVFPFFNQFLFAFTNGFVINGSFILAFEKASVEYKKYAGVLGGIVLQMGIVLGTFLAIPMEAIVAPDI